MTNREKTYLIVLHRIAAIAGKTIPELLNDTWECHADYVESITPFHEDGLAGELSPDLEPSLTRPTINL